MSKPFPCCCACVNCPHYDDKWVIRVENMLGPAAGVNFVSSTTGNPLHVDVAALWPYVFDFTSFSATSGTYSAIPPAFIGRTWQYTRLTISGLTTFTITQVRLVVTVRENCSKVWLSEARFEASVTGTDGSLNPNFPLMQFTDILGSTAPTTPNCFSEVSLTQTHDGTYMRSSNGTTFVYVKPATMATVNISSVGSSLVS